MALFFSMGAILSTPILAAQDTPSQTTCKQDVINTPYPISSDCGQENVININNTTFVDSTCQACCAKEDGTVTACSWTPGHLNISLKCSGSLTTCGTAKTGKKPS